MHGETCAQIQYNYCLPMCVSISFYPARLDNHFLLGHHQGATTADWLRPWLATDIDEYDKSRH